MAEPLSSYLVCASQRSGTTMLCRALADTGIAGAPDEYFLAVAEEDEQPGWGYWENGLFGTLTSATDRESYLAAVYELGTTPNGVFAAKLMWNNVPWAIRKFQEMDRFAELDRAEVLHRALPNLRAIHVTRRDRLRQAVSWARAAQDGVWTISEFEPAAPQAQPVYDPSLIRNLLGLIEDSERGWRGLFSELGIEAYEVAYEDLATNEGYALALHGILAYLGVDASTIAVPVRRTHRRADALNEEWVERYLAEPGPGTSD